MDFSEKDLEELRRLEHSILHSDGRESPDKLAKIIAEEFIEFGASGKVYNKRETIEAVVHTGTDSVSLTEFNAHTLAQNLALVTYRSTKQKPGGSEEHALRSSIWRRTKNGWRLLFHQGTPSPQPE